MCSQLIGYHRNPALTSAENAVKSFLETDEGVFCMILSQPDFSVQPTGAAPKAGDLLVCFDRGRILLDVSGDVPVLPGAEHLISQPFELAHTQSVTLFSPHPFEGGETVPETDELRYQELSVFRTLPEETSALITSCWHLWTWYQSHRFCGKCAHPLTPVSAERALRCPSCGHLVFPVICPAVIVAITCGDHILLAKSARGNFRRFALIAGYVEVGETIEHALRREVMEETGLALTSVRYLGDQPWGSSGSHMFAFHATADMSAPLRIQPEELAEVRWFHRDELQPADNTISIAFEMIERFRKGTL